MSQNGGLHFTDFKVKVENDFLSTGRQSMMSNKQLLQKLELGDMH